MEPVALEGSQPVPQGLVPPLGGLLGLRSLAPILEGLVHENGGPLGPESPKKSAPLLKSLVYQVDGHFRVTSVPNSVLLAVFPF